MNESLCDFNNVHFIKSFLSVHVLCACTHLVALKLVDLYLCSIEGDLF